MKQISRRQIFRVSLAIVLVGGAMALALWAHFANPDTTRYAPAIALVPTHQLQEDTIGRIDLSKSFPGLTPRDEMFITRHFDNSFLAFFPTYYGHGLAISGLMYTSRPLQDADTYSRDFQVQLDYRLIDVAGWHKLFIDQRLDDHWYRVSRGLR